MMKDMSYFLYVFVGGGLGSMARYALGLFAKHCFKSALYPWGTFMANVLGCLLIGFLVALLGKYGKLGSSWYLLGVTGFCGGFTTFSSFALENQNLWKSGAYFTFLLYTGASFLLGLLAIGIGLSIAKHYF